MTVAGGIPEGRHGALWFLLAAVGCALAAGAIATAMVSSARRETTVVVAARDVSPLSLVVPADVQVVQLPVAAVPSGAIRATAGVVDHFTRMGLVPGEVVTAAALAQAAGTTSADDLRLQQLLAARDCPATGGDAAAGPAPGAPAQPRVNCGPLVAMALPLTADQGFGLVQSGDLVDVTGSYSATAGQVAQVVAADVPVLDRIAGSAGSALTGGAGVAAAGWLVLAVSPDQAVRLQLVLASGHPGVLLEAPGAAPEPPALASEVVDAAGLAGGPAAAPALPASAGLLP